MRSTLKKTSFPACIFLAVSCLVVIFQAVSLYHRGSRGESDISVFHRATQLLQNGIGGELYTLKDSKTDWPIPIPPAGLAFFQPLASLDSAASTLLWAIFNVVLLVMAVVALYKCFTLLQSERRVHLHIFPYAAAIFLLLAGGSLQVGQYSILFTSFWIFALYACASRRSWLVGAFFALPAAIKLYPALLLAAPLVANRTGAGRGKALGGFFLGFAFFALLLPAIFYGPRTLELNTSWWQNVIISRESRMAEMQNLGSVNNQSIDAVALRYFTHDVKFHKKFSHLPHLSLSPQRVLQAANIIRLLVLLATIVVVFLWFRGRRETTFYDYLLMAALWSATLYLMLPETRARYAVYAALAFIPLLSSALAAARRNERVAYFLRCALVWVCLILTLSLIPKSMRGLGIGIIGPLLLWLANMSAVWRQRALN